MVFAKEATGRLGSTKPRIRTRQGITIRPRRKIACQGPDRQVMTTFSEQSSAYRPVDKLREYPVNGQPLAPLSLMSIIGSAGCALRQAQEISLGGHAEG